MTWDLEQELDRGLGEYRKAPTRWGCWPFLAGIVLLYAVIGAVGYALYRAWAEWFS